MWLCVASSARSFTLPGLLFASILVGCVQSGNSSPPGEAPTADAGADQSVVSGDTVTLHATGTDPEGAALTFAWAQTAGSPTVVLTRADTDTAFFTAPADGGVLTFTVTVTDPDGLSSTDELDVTVTAPTPPTVTPRLYVANFAGNSVINFANPSSVDGNVAPAPPDGTALLGANTQLNEPSDIAVDAAGTLLASNFAAAALSITSYADAAAADGNLIPGGTVQGASTQLAGGPVSMAVDGANKLLFVSTFGGTPAVRVFDISGSFTGDLAPIRTITSAGALTAPTGINLDTHGSLYVANNATNSILVYENAANLTGEVAPTRTITGNPALTGLFDVFVDGKDRMYAVNSVGGRISIFNNAPALNGASTPDFTLTVLGAGVLTSIVVDSAGRGYITERLPALGKIYSYDGISTLDGAISPTRTIVGSKTELNEPIRLFLQE